LFFEFPKDFKSLKPISGFLVHAVSGQRLMLAHVTVQPDSENPPHSHFEEQMGIILEGELELTIGDATKLLKKGDMYHVPSNTIHGGVTHSERAVFLDALSPPREAFK